MVICEFLFFGQDPPSPTDPVVTAVLRFNLLFVPMLISQLGLLLAAQPWYLGEHMLEKEAKCISRP